MTGADFYQLAVELSAGSTPAHMRSVTSRAYYGAFHVACNVLNGAGIVLPKGAQCHEKVPEILANCNDVDVATAGSKLGSLRSQRNDADYRLDKDAPNNKSTAIRHLKIADEIIKCIEQCSEGKPKAGIRDSVRNYASVVQKLVLWC